VPNANATFENEAREARVRVARLLAELGTRLPLRDTGNFAQRSGPQADEASQKLLDLRPSVSFAAMPENEVQEVRARVARLLAELGTHLPSQGTGDSTQRPEPQLAGSQGTSFRSAAMKRGEVAK